MSEPLRKCRVCGLEANTISDLNKFTRNKSCRYGRENYCLGCRNKGLKKTVLPYLRKCRVCGLEAHNEQELELFRKCRNVPYGCESLCKKCHNDMNKTQYKKRDAKPESRLRRIIGCMKQRCYNPNYTKYHNYGGRGITVCDEWRHDSKAFINWALDNGYQNGLQIDRIDNDKGYSSENCRWVTAQENLRNKRDTVTFWETRIKRCPECKRWLSFDDFYKDKSQVNGMSGLCKKCQIKKVTENKRKRKLRFKN